MNKVEITKEELWNYLFNLERINRGSYGIINKIDDNTCIKIYYKDIRESYREKNINLLDEEIDTNVETQMWMLNTKFKYMDSVAIYENELKKLDILTQMHIINEVLFYRGWKIAVTMKYYKGYEELYTAVLKMNKEQIKIVLSKIRNKLDELINSNIFPQDLKSNIIMVNRETLDVVLIDLDDIATRYDTDEYFETKPKVKQYLINTCNSKFKQLKDAYIKN